MSIKITYAEIKAFARKHRKDKFNICDTYDCLVCKMIEYWGYMDAKCHVMFDQFGIGKHDASNFTGEMEDEDEHATEYSFKVPMGYAKVTSHRLTPNEMTGSQIEWAIRRLEDGISPEKVVLSIKNHE